MDEESHDVVTVEWEQPGFGAAVLAAHDEDSDATPSMLASPEFMLPSVGAAFTWYVPAKHHVSVQYAFAMSFSASTLQ